MQDRIDEKLEQLQQLLEEMDEIRPASFSVYENDIEKRAACERYFTKITEAVTDTAFLLIREEGLETPEEDKGAFDVLQKAGIITEGLAEKLKEAKGMRNILAHEYGEVDDEIVFESITTELERDVRSYLRQVQENRRE